MWDRLIQKVRHIIHNKQLDEEKILGENWICNSFSRSSSGFVIEFSPVVLTVSDHIVNNARLEAKRVCLFGWSWLSYRIDFCGKNDIVVYCLPPHLTHIQPLGVGLFSHLQHRYAKAIEDYLTTDISTNRAAFFSFLNVFRAFGIAPLCSGAVVGKLRAPELRWH